MPGRPALLSKSLWAIAAAAVLGVPASAAAAPIVVDTTSDTSSAGAPCTLREAIENANTDVASPTNGCAAGSGADTIGFSSLGANPEIALQEGELAPGSASALSIVGPGDLTISADTNSRVFNISGAGAVSISGLEITGADVTAPAGSSQEGGGIRNAAPLTLTDVLVTDNVITATGSVSVAADGAGIFTTGELTLERTVVSSNESHATSSANIASSTARGGGIATGGAPAIHLHHSTVADNEAIAVNTAGAANFEGPEASGAGIRAAGAVDVDHTTISGNLASATVTGSGAGGQAVAQGAGLVALGATTVLELSTVAGNRLHVQLAGADPVQRGGALVLGGGSATLISSTIADNGPDSTSEAQATASANVFSSGATSRTVSNTIIADPTGTGSTNCQGNTPYSSNGTNVDHAPAGASCFGATTDLIADPQLGLLQNTGGPTETMLPACNSPVIDQGTADDQSFTAEDQRGFTRPVDAPNVANQTIDSPDGSEIGAVELQAGQPCPTLGATPPAATTTPAVVPTGQRAAALKKCKKKKRKKARKRCRKRAKRLPV